MTKGAVMEAALGYSKERRSGFHNRRHKGLSLHFPERRSGYDRRDRGRFAEFVRSISFKPGRAALLAGLLSGCNLLDIVMTLWIVSSGVGIEGNPMMAALLGQGSATFVVTKVVLVSGAALIWWWLRRYRSVAEALLVSATLYLGLVIYEVAGIVIFG